MKTKQILFVVGTVVALAVAAAGGWYVGVHSQSTVVATEDSGRKVLYWHDPMVPGSKFDKPGKSPFMDMDLVPVYADQASGGTDPTIVTVRPEIANSLGVRTTAVMRRAGTLAVPRDAVIRTGTRTAVVLALGEGRFQPVDVTLGHETGEVIEITRGLKEGDRVVVSAQFLIDSEASVRASFSRMEAPREAEGKTK